jgi:transcriptional regulator with XRE-family HTH domain
MHEALRLLRVCHDLKSYELAEKLNISKSYLSEIENGKKNISLDLIKKYADIFKTTPSSILLFAESLEKNKSKNIKSFISKKMVQLFMNFCEWKLIDENYFETMCEEAHYFVTDGIKENGYKYCPYCGREIKEIKDLEEE